MIEPLIEIGPISIHLFGMFIALGFLAALYVVQKEAKRKGLDVDQIFNLAILIMIVGIVGARLYYVIAFNPAYYLANPRQIFMLHSGGLSIQGGLLGAIFFGIVYAKYKQLSFYKLADTFAPAIILGQAVARIGCDVFGVEMSKARFWGIVVENQIVHPAQMYESLLNYILFLLLWNYRDKIRYNGQLFLFYLFGFSFNRFIVEFFRTNPLVIGSLSIAHITSLLFMLVSTLFLIIKRNDMKTNKQRLISNSEKIRDSLIILGLVVVSLLIYYTIY